MGLLRLFVGVYPPLTTGLEMLRALDDVGRDRPGLPPYRATPPEQLHLTVQFIGATPTRRLEAVVESVARATSGVRAMRLEPRRLFTLPERGPARLVAVETDAPPPLAEIKDRLVTRLARPRGDRRDRPFRPHLTLCRFRAPTRMTAVDHPLALASFAVAEVKLMRSTLTPSGAEHAEVASFPLEG